MEAKEEKQREIEKSQIKVGGARQGWEGRCPWWEGRCPWCGRRQGREWLWNGALQLPPPGRCAASRFRPNPPARPPPSPPLPLQAKSKMSKAEKAKTKKDKAKSFNQAAAPAKAAKNSKRWN